MVCRRADAGDLCGIPSAKTGLRIINSNRAPVQAIGSAQKSCLSLRAVGTAQKSCLSLRAVGTAQKSCLSLRGSPIIKKIPAGGHCRPSTGIFCDQLITDSSFRSLFALLLTEGRTKCHTVRILISSLLFQTNRVFHILCKYRRQYCREPPRPRSP